MTRNKGNRLDRNPLPDEIRAARAKAALSQRDAANLVFSSTRSWQQWESAIGTPDHRRMHPAAWWLFKLRTGQATLADLV